MTPLDQYYFFLQAYDLLGKHLYAREWTGRELVEKSRLSPNEAAKLRKRAEAKIARLDKQIENLEAKIRKSTNDELVRASEKEIDVLTNKRMTALNELHKVAIPETRYVAAYDAWRRREETEDMLIEALRTNALSACFGLFGHAVPTQLWQGVPGFNYYLEQSVAVGRRNDFGVRRETLFLAKSKFDAWLKKQTSIVEGEEAPLTPEMECELFLRERIQRGEKEYPKSEYWRDAESAIPELSYRAFERAWKIVPPEWKRRGPMPRRAPINAP